MKYLISNGMEDCAERMDQLLNSAGDGELSEIEREYLTDIINDLLIIIIDLHKSDEFLFQEAAQL